MPAGAALAPARGRKRAAPARAKAQAARQRASVAAAAVQLGLPAEDAQLWLDVLQAAARLRASALLAACAQASAQDLA